VDMPDGAAVRIGWSQELGNLQGPCGYDKFSYAWRSRKGTAFHQAKGKHFSAEGYGQGDVLGVWIDLPEDLNVKKLGEFKAKNVGKSEKRSKNLNAEKSSEICDYGENCGNFQNVGTFLPETHKERPLVKFKQYLYFEEKDDLNKISKDLQPLPGSSMKFYRNGQCVGTAFTDVFGGTYYPAASFYKNVTLSFNFGPDFKHPPTDVPFKPLGDLAIESATEQTLADTIYFAENWGKLRLDTFYGVTN